MSIVLYQVPSSPPCRAVMMTAEKLNIKLDHKFVDMRAGEHLKPEFLAINPQHCLPTIDDEGFYLWDSHAIMTYLVNQYAPGNSLYPENPQIRAAVDKMLYFDIGTINSSLLDYLRPIFFENKDPDSEKGEVLRRALATFEELLGKTNYAACDHLTLADFSLLASLSTVVESEVYSLTPFPRITAWYKKLKVEIPHFKEINEEPLQEFKKMAESKKLNKDN